MMITKEDIQHLIDANTGVLPLAGADIKVFNLKTNQFASLSIRDTLSADNMVCLCDQENPASNRPHPEPVDASMFRKLEQDELGNGSPSNKLMFTPEISGEKLVISYKGKPIYEEPLYMSFECEDDDEPDECMEASAFFEDRMRSFNPVLKAVYGRSAWLKRSSIAYPAVRVTRDIEGWLYDQLEASDDGSGDDLLAVLKFLLLDAGSEAVFNDFISMASSPSGDVESIVDALFLEYTRYCGISAGYRTCLWDGMVAVYAYFDRNPDHEKIVARIDARFETEEFKEFQEYDIIITTPLESLILLATLFRNEEITCRKAMVMAMFCFTMTGGDC